MLFAALKLSLSLVGSMLASICASESNTLNWLHLLMQVIFSGAIDRKTDTRYVGEETTYLGNEKKQQPQLIYDYIKTTMLE